MIYSNFQITDFDSISFPVRKLFAGFFLIFLFVLSICAQSVSQPDENTIVAEGSQVLEFGKNVIVQKDAEDVCVIGGDVIIEGNVEGDVAAIGGNIIQKQDAFIGGDVIVFGGTYKHERAEPLRAAGKESIIVGGFEEELRDLARNPAQILSPQLTWAFLIQRLLSVLFWFVISLAVTTIAPGAVSRSVARFRLSTSKIAGIGLLGFLTFVFGVFGSLKFLPNYLGAIVSLMTFVLLILSYVFGRVTMQVSAGKWLQKQFLSDKKHSESVALLIGAFVWTFILSLPYIWAFALFFLFIVSLGIILTARSPISWQKS
ncbi:MAG: hypothetical protein ACR2LT_04540 [Pyrinomonadaceae bacterium]